MFKMAGIGPQLPPHLLKAKSKEDKSLKKSIDSEVDPVLSTDGIGPQLPSELSSSDDVINEIIDSYGPSLPPSFNQNKGKKVVGPCLPPVNVNQNETDSDEDVVGPCLPSGNVESRSVEEEFEARATAMKNKLTGKTEDGKLQRENWMLELPPEMSKNFGLGPRTFRSKAVDLGDRSVWTDTPADRERKKKERQESAMKSAGEKRKSVEPAQPSQEELELKNRVKDYNEAIRPKSLLEMHQNKNKKSEPDGPSVRRPFDRERDLNIKRSDPKATAKFINDAKGLNSKFSKGSYEKKFL